MAPGCAWTEMRRHECVGTNAPTEVNFPMCEDLRNFLFQWLSVEPAENVSLVFGDFWRELRHRCFIEHVHFGRFMFIVIFFITICFNEDSILSKRNVFIFRCICFILVENGNDTCLFFYNLFHIFHRSWTGFGLPEKGEHRHRYV